MTTLSYNSQADKDADKALLEIAREALGISPSMLRLDDCELWRLIGSRGSIATWGDGQGYLLAIHTQSALGWTWAKKRLGAVPLPIVWFKTKTFPPMAITQDAIDSGILRFTLPVSQDLTVEIRELAGLRKQIPEETRAALAASIRERGLAPKLEIEPQPRND